MDFDSMGLPWWLPQPGYLALGALLSLELLILAVASGFALRDKPVAAGLAAVGFAGAGLWHLFLVCIYGAVLGAIYRGLVPLGPVSEGVATTVIGVMLDAPSLLFHLCVVGAAFAGRTRAAEGA